MFGFRVSAWVFHFKEETVWVYLDCLFNLYQRRQLNIEKLSLLTM